MTAERVADDGGRLHVGKPVTITAGGCTRRGRVSVIGMRMVAVRVNSEGGGGELWRFPWQVQDDTDRGER